MAPLSMPLNDPEDHFCCLKPNYHLVKHCKNLLSLRVARSLCDSWASCSGGQLLCVMIESHCFALERKERKGKEEYLYSAIYTSLKVLRHGSHSFACKLQHACLYFVSVNQMASPLTEIADIQLQLTTYWSTPKGWKAELAWLVDLQRTVYPHKWSPVSYRSSAGQGKFAGQRPTFYRCARQLALPAVIVRVKWRHSNLWSRYDLHVVGHNVVLCGVNWWRFVTLFK